MTQCVAELNNERCQREGDRGRNLCAMHAQQKQRHGRIRNIIATRHRERLAMPAPKRFASRIKPGGLDGQCWEWTGHKDKDGYGKFSDRGGKHRAHRWAWKYLVDPSPTRETELDHICRNPACVRPSHLQPLTRREHSKLGIRQADLEKNNPDCDLVGGNRKARSIQELNYAVTHNLPSTMHGARLATVGQ